MPRIALLGIPIDAVTTQEVLQRINGFFRQLGQFHIATPNPEMLVEAKRNPAFRKVLEGTSLNIPDGVGLLWAAKRMGSPLPERVTGTDILPKICAASRGERIFLLGAAPGVAERASEKLLEAMPFLRIVGTDSGSAKMEDEERIIRKITGAMPTLLFVAFGAPAQDLWIARNLAKLPTIKVAMGVGGAFDFIVGVQKRAPRFLRSLGLEWLWRLLLQPRRIVRIWNAVVVFPWMIRREKIV